jgi:iron(III) transport system substrate-binding protein
MVAAAMPAAAAETLPEKFANDPVAKALGPEIFNAALKEGKVNWYGADVTDDFLKAGGKANFEKRFGIKMVETIGRLREQTDRLRTEGSVNKRVADVFDGNDQYMLELYALGFLEKWRPPAPELDRIAKEVFVTEPAGYWWPMHMSAQALFINTSLVKPADEPKSFQDILDPKWKGKIAIRDPRSSSGGGWQFLQIYGQKGMGIDYIKKLKAQNPFIIPGGSEQMRDAIATGRFAIGFNGRGEFIRDLPKGTPVKYIVPKEGLAWTPSSLALMKGGPNPNAAKVLLTWMYEVPQIQLWSNSGRPVPHPDVKMEIKEMEVAGYPIMEQIPSKVLAEPNFFFKEMEQVFGVR